VRRVVVLVWLAASSSGCERDFSFLQQQVQGDASTLDAQKPADVGTPEENVPRDAADVSVVPEADAADVGIDDDGARDVSVPDMGNDSMPGTADAPETSAPRFLTHQIAMSGSHLCVIHPDTGSVLCKGEETDAGPESDASASGWRVITSSLDGGTSLGGVRSIAVGQSFGCAIAAGDVLCWGTDPGTSEYAPLARPVRAGMALNVENIQAGESHVCVADPVTCWGDNTYAQLADPAEFDAAGIREPTVMPALANMTLLTLGRWHTCAKDGDRTVCWGLNDFRQCGDVSGRVCAGSFPCAPQPLEVSGVAGALGLGLGETHSCAIKRDGTVACWGASDVGQSGVVAGGDCPDGCVVGVTSVDAANDVTRLALGSAHSCALTTGGFVYCWGSNEAGQLGIGNIGNHRATAGRVFTSDTDTTALSDVIDIAASEAFTCALTSTHKLYCWGFRKNEPLLAAATEIPLPLL
jgi:Regulator of chromosome condensation (RCC1) repeat